jgi:hypothetical protein
MDIYQIPYGTSAMHTYVWRPQYIEIITLFLILLQCDIIVLCFPSMSSLASRNGWCSVHICITTEFAHEAKKIFWIKDKSRQIDVSTFKIAIWSQVILFSYPVWTSYSPAIHMMIFTGDEKRPMQSRCLHGGILIFTAIESHCVFSRWMSPAQISGLCIELMNGLMLHRWVFSKYQLSIVKRFLYSIM